MTETQKRQQVRIYVSFSASLEECPACGFAQEFTDEFGKVECRNCSYHAGGDLAVQWTEYWDKSPDPPAFIEIEDTHYGDGNYCEVSIPEDIKESQVQLLENWLHALGDGTYIDEESFSDGILRRNGCLWFRMYTHYNAAPAGDVWDIRTQTQLVELQAELADESNDALALDRKACEWAIEQATAGKTVYVAQDEDGFYFAVRVE